MMGVYSHTQQYCGNYMRNNFLETEPFVDLLLFACKSSSLQQIIFQTHKTTTGKQKHQGYPSQYMANICDGTAFLYIYFFYISNASKAREFLSFVCLFMYV